ncbi:RND transporter [Azospirillum sp. TSO35-2]|nr:RND transporter [Azospirillum sp. TSO35-2]
MAQPAAEGPVPPAAPFQVERRPVEDLKAVFATVESVRQTKARTRIAGTLTGLRVVEGDRVADGQVIASVVDPKLALQAAALDARLESLRAQTRQAETELARARQLRASGTGTQQKLDDTQTALDVLRAQTAAMTADRAVVEQQRREGEVLAPAAGRILQVTAIAGAVTMAGEPVATIATDRHVLRLRLPERHARFIKAGDPVLVGERGLAPATAADTDGADRLARGTIRLVYPELEAGQVVADAEMPADGATDGAGTGGYFVGERVRVLVATGTREALVVPPVYLTVRSGAEMAVLADGREVVVRSGRPVPALGDRPAGVEVLSGLRPGDRLVKPLGTTETAR